MTAKKSAPKKSAKKSAPRDVLDAGAVYGEPLDELPDGSDGVFVVRSAVDGAYFLPSSVRRHGIDAEEVASALQSLVIDAQRIDAAIAEAVARGREVGLSWEAVGWCLGMSGEGVRRRFSDE